MLDRPQRQRKVSAKRLQFSLELEQQRQPKKPKTSRAAPKPTTTHTPAYSAPAESSGTASKAAAIGGAPGQANSSGCPGIRRNSHRWTAMLLKGMSPEVKTQKYLGSYATIEEAQAAQAGALAALHSSHPSASQQAKHARQPANAKRMLAEGPGPPTVKRQQLTASGEHSGPTGKASSRATPVSSSAAQASSQTAGHIASSPLPQDSGATISVEHSACEAESAVSQHAESRPAPKKHVPAEHDQQQPQQLGTSDDAAELARRRDSTLSVQHSRSCLTLAVPAGPAPVEEDICPTTPSAGDRNPHGAQPRVGGKHQRELSTDTEAEAFRTEGSREWSSVPRMQAEQAPTPDAPTKQQRSVGASAASMHSAAPTPAGSLDALLSPGSAARAHLERRESAAGQPAAQRCLFGDAAPALVPTAEPSRQSAQQAPAAQERATATASTTAQQRQSSSSPLPRCAVPPKQPTLITCSTCPASSLRPTAAITATPVAPSRPSGDVTLITPEAAATSATKAAAPKAGVANRSGTQSALTGKYSQAVGSQAVQQPGTMQIQAQAVVYPSPRQPAGGPAIQQAPPSPSSTATAQAANVKPAAAVVPARHQEQHSGKAAAPARPANSSRQAPSAQTPLACQQESLPSTANLGSLMPATSSTAAAKARSGSSLAALAYLPAKQPSPAATPTSSAPVSGTVASTARTPVTPLARGAGATAGPQQAQRAGLKSAAGAAQGTQAKAMCAAGQRQRLATPCAAQGTAGTAAKAVTGPAQSSAGAPVAAQKAAGKLLASLAKACDKASAPPRAATAPAAQAKPAAKPVCQASVAKPPTARQRAPKPTALVPIKSRLPPASRARYGLRVGAPAQHGKLPRCSPTCAGPPVCWCHRSQFWLVTHMHSLLDPDVVMPASSAGTQHTKGASGATRGAAHGPPVRVAAASAPAAKVAAMGLADLIFAAVPFVVDYQDPAPDVSIVQPEFPPHSAYEVSLHTQLPSGSLPLPEIPGARGPDGGGQAGLDQHIIRDPSTITVGELLADMRLLA